MGCGASIGDDRPVESTRKFEAVSPTKEIHTLVIPCWLTNSQDPSRASSGDPQELAGALVQRSVSVREEGRARSSVESSNWTDNPPRGVPLPPDARLDRKFAGRLENMMDFVEDEPGKLYMEVAHRRRGQPNMPGEIPLEIE